LLSKSSFEQPPFLSSSTLVQQSFYADSAPAHQCIAPSLEKYVKVVPELPCDDVLSMTAPEGKYLCTAETQMVALACHCRRIPITQNDGLLIYRYAVVWTRPVCTYYTNFRSRATHSGTSICVVALCRPIPWLLRPKCTPWVYFSPAESSPPHTSA